LEWGIDIPLQKVYETMRAPACSKRWGKKNSKGPIPRFTARKNTALRLAEFRKKTLVGGNSGPDSGRARMAWYIRSLGDEKGEKKKGEPELKKGTKKGEGAPARLISEGIDERSWGGGNGKPSRDNWKFSCISYLHSELKKKRFVGRSATPAFFLKGREGEESDTILNGRK